MEKHWGLEWAAQTLDSCNKITIFLSDSGPAKIMVQTAQVELYKKKRQIVVKCSSGWWRRMRSPFSSPFFVKALRASLKPRP
mgnify:CR=1 FL=1